MTRRIPSLASQWLVPVLMAGFTPSLMAQELGSIEPELPYSQYARPNEAAEAREQSGNLPNAQLFYKAGSEQDVRVQTARNLAEQKRYLSAATELVGITRNRSIEAMPEAFHWQIGDTYLGFSVQHARQMYRLAGTGSTDRERYARAQMLIADQDFRLGRNESAARVLNALREDLPQSEVNSWKFQLTRVLLAMGQYADAIEMLEELDEADGDDDMDPFIRYNLGLAQLNDGRALDGRDTLDKVGRMVARTEPEYALRDRANLVLGWHFLQNELGGTAKTVLQRVRVEGAASSRALLGLGWAELQPRGERQARNAILEEENDPYNSLMTLGGMLRPGFIEDGIYRRSGFAIYTRAKMGKDEEQSLQRALAAWILLIDRDPMDPAVQEASLAIPYTLDRIGAHTQALEHYEKAIDLLELNRQRQRAAMKSIDSGVMLNTLVLRDGGDESSRDWELRDLPDVPETYYLQSLLASHRFQEGLKNYRDLRLMWQTMQGWEERLEAVLQAYRRNTRDPVEPELLFAAATLDREPAKANIVLSLKTDPDLAPPGRYQRPSEALQSSSVRLAPAAMPGTFDGTYEQATRLRQEATVLRSQLELATNEQQAVMNEVARSALSEQQLTIEKYLVEARFALARLYDRERQNPAPESDSEAR